MTTADKSLKNSLPLFWHCIGASVQGAAHQRTHLPNQDAIRWQILGQSSGDAIEQTVILAVSDGHGSAKSFRSHIGSQLAVETAIELIQELPFDKQHEAVNFATLKDLVQFRLPQQIASTWAEKVRQHWQISQREGEQLDETQAATESPIDQPQAKADLEIVYGATLLAVAITASFILYLQLGDGDILCVDSCGQVTRPLSPDAKLFANQTTSLCTANAWSEFRIHLDRIPTEASAQFPALILLSTDGYANSYPSEAEFLKIAPDYLEMIQTEGIERIRQQLPQFLQETSENGSGDDITLGLLQGLNSHVSLSTQETNTQLPKKSHEVEGRQSIDLPEKENQAA